MAISIGEMTRMREAGFTYKEIGRKGGVHWTTIRSRCQRLGIKPKVKVIHSRNRKATFEPEYWLIDTMYWECGLSTNEIAFELDVSKNTLQTWMGRHNFPRRSRKEAWELMKTKGNGPYRRPWSRDEAIYMAGLAKEARRKKRELRDAA